MKKFTLLCLLLAISISSFSQSTIIKYLSGTDKDHTVQWDFYMSAGRKSGQWTKIAVPSNWEQQGFGAYHYGHDKNKSKEQGIYKHQFFAQPNWAGKKIFIAFEGAMTDTKVMINGKQAGPVHQGGFYRFKYDITSLVKPNAQNQLEVTVDGASADKSIDHAERDGDFWVFAGIFRPVYLEITPATFIDRMAINAKADGSFQTDVYAQNLKGDEIIEAQVQTLKGQNVGKPFTIKANAGADHQELKSSFNKPLLWSSEYPNLYRVVIAIKNKKGTVLHSVKQKFGFRTVEVRKNDGLYINGARMVLKGSNRHSFWPETGRTLSHNIHVLDTKLMKDMNMNAVRMSHYPPDQDFLDVCDSVGLYVLDELTGWEAKYDTIPGRKLVKELVVRDVNHPSIIFWDNGNEGGWNTGLDNDYDLYDPQKREVIHPWETFRKTNTKHYPDYSHIVKSVATEQNVFFPTEFMHGLYDGGAGAALDDFWSLMMTHPHNAGGFIWAFLDESIMRTDKNNEYDSDGNHAPDGIVGPHREKEASYFTIKEIWSPVYINPQPIEAGFDGKIAVENRYAFTNLNKCTFKWKLVKFPTAAAKSTAAITVANGVAPSPNLAPGQKGTVNLPLPANWNKSDALYLTAYDHNNKEVFTWSWAITAPSAIAKAPVMSVRMPITATESGNDLIINSNRVKYYFDKTTGYISKVVKSNATVSLSGGPVLAGVSTTLKQFGYKETNGTYIVEADYEGAATLHVKWTFAWGQPVKLDYTYTQTGNADFMGITFNYPEDKITGMKWLGRGPYKVWKNRLRGQQFGVWHKAYNNSITGETWGYPEFKGYHAEVNWAVIENKEAPFTVYTDNKNLFLQMLNPAREKAALKENNVEPPFPEGNLGFLNGISAIGTKFQPARVMGPQSQKNRLDGQPINGTLWFEF
jgi:hypothetical protein